MRVLNAMQLKNGAKAESGDTFSSLTQPIQFLPYLELTPVFPPIDEST